MKKVLIIYAHPTAQNSRLNKALLQQISNNSNVTVSDLYAKYPDGKINATDEQKLIDQHDLLILQFPFYWFSATPLMKKWIDEILTLGYTFGPGGLSSQNKDFLLALTIGRTKERYLSETEFNLPQLLKPFEYSVQYCNMNYRQPFVIAEADTVSESELLQQTQEYAKLLNNYIANGSLAFSESYPSFT